MINNLSQAENGPNEVFENRLSKELVHRYQKNKWIRNNELEELALKKYHTNGRGITFSDVVD